MHIREAPHDKVDLGPVVGPSRGGWFGVEGLASVDDDVTGLHRLGDLVDDGVSGVGRLDHDDDASRLLQGGKVPGSSAADEVAFGAVRLESASVLATERLCRATV